jgi:hypothetical protein
MREVLGRIGIVFAAFSEVSQALIFPIEEPIR